MIMSKKLEEYDESILVNNPFSFTLEIPTTKVVSDKFRLLPADVQGEQGTLIRDTFHIEQTQSVRMYYCPGCKHSVYNLSDKAQRLYLYILYNLERKKDYIQINREDYMLKNNVKSNTTYLAAMDELIRYMFLQYTKYKTVFWTNPFLFSSSDRIAKYPDRIQEKGYLT